MSNLKDTIQKHVDNLKNQHNQKPIEQKSF